MSRTVQAVDDVTTWGSKTAEECIALLDTLLMSVLHSTYTPAGANRLAPFLVTKQLWEPHHRPLFMHPRDETRAFIRWRRVRQTFCGAETLGQSDLDAFYSLVLPSAETPLPCIKSVGGERVSCRGGVLLWEHPPAAGSCPVRHRRTTG
jgi:hypothetical protein